MILLRKIGMLALISFTLVSVTTADLAVLYSCDEIPIRLADWDDNFSIQKFDPSLGDLKEVSLQIELNTSQDISFENKGNSSSGVDINSEVTLLMTMPNSEIIYINDSIAYSDDLDPFDGIIDFSGPSGLSVSGLVGDNVETYPYSNLSDFIGSSPNDTIEIPAHTMSTIQISGVADYSATIKTFVGSELCVAYAYDPKISPEGDI